MKDTLRIDLPPEVLPFSNIPRGFRLFLLSPARAFVAAG